MNLTETKPEWFLPFYCPECGHLSFIRKRRDFEDRFIDYFAGQWREHPCVFKNAKKLIGSPYVLKMNEFELGSPRLPFRLRTAKRSLKAQEFHFGVIIEIQPGNGSQSLLVLSPDDRLVNIKAVVEAQDISAGMLIDLTDLTRVGKELYRLAELKSVSLPDTFTLEDGVLGGVFQITLEADDQEQLESYINQLLRWFKDQNTLPFSLIPLPILLQEDKTVHRRQISFYFVPEILKKLRQISAPDYIRLTVKEQP